MSRIKQAVILSAGLGTRLKSLTDTMPKVMVPLAGKPLLEYHLAHFKKHGVKEFFINLHYLPDIVKNHFGDGHKYGVKINYAYEPELLGTAGGLKNFSERLQDNFFVIYGDIFSLVNYTSMAQGFWDRPEMMGMVVVGQNNHPYDSDLAILDKDLRLAKILPKPHRYLPPAYMAMKGVYIFNSRVLSNIPGQAYYEIDHHLLPALLAKGECFYGYEIGDYLQDVGTPERYQEINNFLKSNLIIRDHG